MWYEILPTLGIMWGAMTLGFYGSQFVPWLAYGHRQFKECYKAGSIFMYHRDEQLDGLTEIATGVYRQKGLDNIPDEAPSSNE